MKTRLLLVFVSLFFSQAIGQTQHDNYVILNEESGLPQNFVNTLTQDSRGFIWIGTGKGLSNYDSRKIQTFQKKDGLFDDFITTSFQASSGHLLFGHFSGGISDFNGVYHTTLFKDTLHSEVVAIGEDKQGVIWCASISGRILRIEPKLSSYKIITPDELKGKIIHDMLVKGNYLLVATNEGLFRFLISQDGLHFADALAEIQYEEIFSLCPSHNSPFVWAGSSGKIYRIIDKDNLPSPSGEGPVCPPEPWRRWGMRQHNSLIVADTYKLSPDNESNVLALSENKKGELWIGTMDKGLFQMELNEKKEITSFKSFNQETGYPIQSVKSILIDSREDVWIGTPNEGVIKICRQLFQYDDVEQYGVDRINDIQIRSGIYYLATRNGLYVYDRSKNGAAGVHPISAFQHEEIICVLPRTDSVLWVGTATHGVVLYDQKRSKKTILPIYSDAETLLKVRLMRSDAQGNCWVASFGHGVYKLSSQGEILQHLTTNNGFIHNDIFALFPATDGVVWFGSRGAGLARLDKDNSLKRFSQNGLFSSFDVNDITGDAKGNVWIATNGQGYFHYGDNKFTSLSGATESQTQFIKSIQYSKKRHGLWISQKGGLCFVDLLTLQRRNFTQHEGLRNNIDYSNKLSMQGDDLVSNNGAGFTIIREDAMVKSEVTIPVMTEVKLFFHTPIEIKPSQSEVKNHIYPELSLEYNKNHLTFDYTVPNNATLIYYRYQIKEIEKEWSSITTESQATYSSINPGSYTFLIQASIDPDHWSSAPLVYKFSIQKPYWQRLWFYFLQVSLVYMSFGLTYYFSRTNKVKASIISLMTFMCLFIIYEFVQDWAENLFPSLRAGTPIIKTLIDLMFAFIFYPLEKWAREFFNRDKASNSLPLPRSVSPQTGWSSRGRED